MNLMKSTVVTEKAIENGELNLTSAGLIGDFVAQEEQDEGVRLTPQQKDEIVLPLIGKPTRAVEKELRRVIGAEEKLRL